jgi:hypothetical protein
MGYTTNTTEIQSIIREYFKNRYSNKLKNLEAMDKFLYQPKLNQEGISHLSRSITRNETEAVLKNFLTKKLPKS